MFQPKKNAMEVFMMSMFGSDYYNTIYPNQNKDYKKDIQNQYMHYAAHSGFWRDVYTNWNKNNTPQAPTNDQMYNCIFKTTQGFNFNIPFSGNRTMEDLIQTFFKRVDKETLFNQRKVSFIFNAGNIKYNSKELVKDIFKTNVSPSITVVDTHNLIGA